MYFCAVNSKAVSVTSLRDLHTGQGCVCMISANVLSFQVHWTRACCSAFLNPLVKGVCMISANVLSLEFHWRRVCLYDFSQCTELPILLEKGVFVWFQSVYWASNSIGEGGVCMISVNVLSFEFHCQGGVCMISVNVLSFEFYWRRVVFVRIQPMYWASNSIEQGVCLYDFSQCTELPIPLDEGCVCIISAHALS